MQQKWDRIQDSQTFRTLLSKKRRFIIPAMAFFVIYYFTLPIMAGYFKQVLATKVVGSLTVGYLFALSQFFMAWGIAYLYVRAADGFDKLADRVRSESAVEADRVVAK